MGWFQNGQKQVQQGQTGAAPKGASSEQREQHDAGAAHQRELNRQKAEENKDKR